MWPNIIDCIESDVDINRKVSYLNSLFHVGGLNLEFEEGALIKAKICQYCSDPTRRAEGLLLLYSVVHSSSSIYIESWSQIVLATLKCPELGISKEIPFAILKKMLLNFGNVVDYAEVFSNVVPEVLSLLLDLECDSRTYHCISVCLQHVPEIAGTRIDEIQLILLKGMNNPSREVNEAIGECFAALPLCMLHVQRMASVQYKDVWLSLFNKFLNTVNSLLNSLLKGDEGHSNFVDVSGLPVFKIPSLESDDSIPILKFDVFNSLCICLAKMLSSGKHIPIPVINVLETLFRIWNIRNIIIVKNQDSKTGYYKICLPSMLNGAYILLEALIINFSLIDQAHNFVGFINASLSSMEETFSPSSTSRVRGSTWKLINIWLKQYGSKGSLPLTNDGTILEKILTDINIYEKQIENNSENDENKIFACIQALKVLQNLFEFGCYAEKHSVNKICSTLIRISKIVLQYLQPAKKIPLPYSDEKCRTLLFATLCTYATYSSPLHSNCMEEARKVFPKASRDKSIRIRQICHKFKKISKYYLNPIKPPPEALQYAQCSMLNSTQKPVTDILKNEWRKNIDWESLKGPSSNDQVVKNENDFMPRGETVCSTNHDDKISNQPSQSESIDDSDIEPTYISDSDPQRIVNDSSHINSFDMQPCVEQYANETRAERLAPEVVPSTSNSVENNINRVSPFVDVQLAQNTLQTTLGNGHSEKKDINEYEEESDMDEENDEEASDNVGDEVSDGQRSSDSDEERPTKRQRHIEDVVDEEDNHITLNNQSSDEENDNNVPTSINNAESNSENSIDDDEDLENEEVRKSGSPTIKEMCMDFVLKEVDYINN